MRARIRCQCSMGQQRVRPRVRGVRLGLIDRLTRVYVYVYVRVSRVRSFCGGILGRKTALQRGIRFG